MTVRSPVKYIIRSKAMGDVLWIEPVIKAVAQIYKKVVVISDYNDVFDNYPLPNVRFKKKMSFFERFLFKIESLFKTQYVFIDLNNAYEQNSNMHILLAYYHKAKRSGLFKYPALYISENELEEYNVKSSKYVIIHLENYPKGFNFRNIYGIDWEIVCNYLTSLGFKVIQIGRVENQINTKNVEFVNTTVRQLILLLKKSSFFIGMDSGPSHIAQSLGIPSLIFFGSVNPWFRHIKHQFKGFFLQQTCEYAGCFHSQSPGKQTCLLIGDNGDPKCCTFTTEYVIEYIDKLINKYQP